MTKQPSQEHVETSAFVEELLQILDRDASEDELRHELAACLHWQERLRRWLSRGPEPGARWLGYTLTQAEDLLLAMETEEEDIRQALLDLLGCPNRELDADELAMVERYERKTYRGVKPPANPDLAEPGSPEKVQLLSGRLNAKLGLWHREDAELEPTIRTAYMPVHSAGNFATIGRREVLLLLMSAPRSEGGVA